MKCDRTKHCRAHRRVARGRSCRARGAGLPQACGVLMSLSTLTPSQDHAVVDNVDSDSFITMSCATPARQAGQLPGALGASSSRGDGEDAIGAKRVPETPTRKHKHGVDSK
eukprot:15468696-Alexandrium_andersonii.AAC.1